MAGLHDRSRTYHERRIWPEFPRLDSAVDRQLGERSFRGSRKREDFFIALPRPWRRSEKDALSDK